MLAALKCRELPAIGFRDRVSELAQTPGGRPLKARWHANSSAQAQAAWIWDRVELHKQMSGALECREVVAQMERAAGLLQMQQVIQEGNMWSTFGNPVWI